MLPKIDPQKKTAYNIDWEEILLKYRHQFLLFFIGAILISFGALLFKNRESLQSSSIEVLESSTNAESSSFNEVVIEVAGAVESPGVYHLPNNLRIEDALIAAGGISADADRNWMEKTLNRAAKIVDGQKIYIPRIDEQFDVASANNIAGYQTISSSEGSGRVQTVNINTATQKELESLWGIGPVTAQNIIEQRPYSSVEELLEKKILKTNVYEKNKDLLTIY